MTHPRSHRGSALLLVLWALVLLSGAIFAYAAWIRSDIQVHGQANRELEARGMAHSGLALALHPKVTEKTPILEEELAADLGFKAQILSEGAKLNINWLIGGEDPARLDILRRWLEQLGLDLKDQQVFLDCLLDYVDGDDQKRLNGQEADGDYHPPNRPLESVEEIEEVANSALLTKTFGWKDDLTIYSLGPVDISAAQENVLRLVGLTDPQITRLLQIRRGRDNTDFTEDDYVFKNLKEVQSILGIAEAQWKRFGGLVTLKDNTSRIVSVGRSGNVTRQVEVVAQKGGGYPQIRFWKE